MTAALAIAATSEVMRYIIEDALVRAGQALNFQAPSATIGPPPRPPQQGGVGQALVEPASVNLFLHHVSPNPAWRNLNAPERDRQGRRLNNAPLVLDLHYLLSAHGADIDREIGFGTALHALHQVAIVPVELVKLALKSLAGNANPLRKILAGEGLAKQMERLTITPETLDIDAATKIWNAVQSPYRPSAGYLVTTVFLEDDRPSTQALPITANAGLAIVPLSRVSIDDVIGLRNGGAVPITAGARLQITGQGLGGEAVSVTLDDAPLSVDGSVSQQERLVVDLPASLGVGAHYLQVARLAPAGTHMARVASAAVSITLLPRIISVTTQDLVVDPASVDRVSGTLVVAIAPEVRRKDAVILRLTDIVTGTGQDIAWNAPNAAQHPSDMFAEIRVKFAKLRKGTYILRVLCAGIASQPEPAPNGDLGPRVTL